MPKPTPERRLSGSMSAIYRLTAAIKYHDAEASRHRKERARFQAIHDRAEKAISRAATSRNYEATR